ncbi:MAG: prolipoprotein diacylglyceryl transferase [Candidatus Hydrogenedens sp.]|nr:prolipoprotein diacylglyceryl transferase [Candidatus Hydrogenedens sp.]
MRPVLISIGIFELHSYVVCLALGLLVGVSLALKENSRLPQPYPATGKVGIWGLIGGLIGAKTYYVVQYEGLSHWYEMLIFWTGGYVFFGAFIGGTIGVWLYLKKNKIPFLPSADISVPFLCLGHAIGRLGCFLNGCCFGDLCNTPWGIIYPADSGILDHHKFLRLLPNGAQVPIPIHATPIYEVIGLIMIFFLLRMIYKNKSYNGQVLLWYFCLYGAWRFFDENFRGDSSHEIFGMTASQTIALTVCILSGLIIFFLYLLISRKKENPCQTLLSQEESPISTE